MEEFLGTPWIWRLRWQGSPPDVRWKPEDFPTRYTNAARDSTALLPCLYQL
jgi:hypothetical protein